MFTFPCPTSWLPEQPAQIGMKNLRHCHPVYMAKRLYDAGRIQHERLAGQEQRPDQRVCRTADAVVEGTARRHVLQGTRRRYVDNITLSDLRKTITYVSGTGIYPHMPILRPHAARFHERRISSVTFMLAHFYGNVYMRVGVARALADSSDLGLLGEQSL